MYIYPYSTSFGYNEFGEASLQRSAKLILDEASTSAEQEGRIANIVEHCFGLVCPPTCEGSRSEDIKRRSTELLSH